MTESQESGNKHGNYPDLLDILREKRKVRLGNPQPGEYIILEYSVEKANLQPESSIEIPTSSDSKDDKAFEANTNPARESSKETSSNSTDDLASEANANPLLESSGLTNDTDANYKSNNINKDQADASSNKKRNKVFISYSHDSDEHKKRVEELSKSLNKSDGIQCVLDQHVAQLEYPWYRWMRMQIEAADFVIVVCTSKYKERTEIKETGVYHEAIIIEGEISSGLKKDKFISVIFSGRDHICIPSFLYGWYRFTLDVTNKKEYEMNFQDLCNKVKYRPQKLEQKRPDEQGLYERGVIRPES